MSELLTLIEATDLPPRTGANRAAMDEEITRGDEPGALETPMMTCTRGWASSCTQPAAAHASKQTFSHHAASTQPLITPSALSLSLSARYLPTQDDDQRDAITKRFCGVQRALPRQAVAQIRLPSALGDTQIPETEEDLQREDEGEVKERFPSGGAGFFFFFLRRRRSRGRSGAAAHRYVAAARMSCGSSAWRPAAIAAPASKVCMCPRHGIHLRRSNASRCPNSGSDLPARRSSTLDNSDPVPLPVASASAHVQSEADSKHNQTLEWPAWTHHSK